jgi:hypothetical protein
MTRRLVYIAFGATVGILVVRRASAAASRYTPASVQERATASAGGLAGAIREFTAVLKVAMAEREDELREALGLDGSNDVIDTNN